MAMETDKDLQPLTDSEIEERLQNFPGWSYKDNESPSGLLSSGNKLSKKFSFDSFSDAVAFISRLAPFCNKIDHHPDIHIYYKDIVFELQRFSVGGKVTDRDFTVAKEIEKLYAMG
jgi:4a-hydroxytetrahydrobiopterin dehydratase